MPSVFLNGKFVSKDAALVSAFDAGFQHGMGLFETMTAIVTPPASSVVSAAAAASGQDIGQNASQGDSEEHVALRRVRVVHMREHLARLAASARALSLSNDLRIGPLEEAVERTVARAAIESPGVARFRVRLTLTGGDLNLLGRGPAHLEDRAKQRALIPTIVIAAQPAPPYPAEMFGRGVSAGISSWRANADDPYEGHKALHYWPRLRELQLAAARGAAESLVFSSRNLLAGGCVSNAFVVKAGVLITPNARGGDEQGLDRSGDALDAAVGDKHDATGGQREVHAAGGAQGHTDAPVLPGVTRRWVIDWARSRGVATAVRGVTIDDVLDADEFFLTNSSWGVLPVVRVETRPIAGGSVGALTNELVGEWAAVVA